MRRLLTASLALFATCALFPVSRADYYTPDALLTELRADLESWVRAKKGDLSIARDPYHFLELLAESPAGFRVVLHWDGEANPGDEPQAGVFAAQRISLGVTANLGLTAKPGEAMHKPTPDRAALLRLVADVRERVRSYVWPDHTTGRYMLYKGADAIVLPDSGVPLAGFRLTFELTLALPPVEYRNLV